MVKGDGRSGGFALIVVLWFLVLLAAIGAYMIAGGRSETALAHNLIAGAHAEALADAAIARTVFNLSDPDPRRRWPLDGTPDQVPLPGGGASIRIYDETLKINPNLASAGLMSGLFQALGVEKAKAQALGAAVSDWVHPVDTAAGNQQFEPDPYEAAGRSYRAPHAPIESIDELLLVMGMTAPVLTQARPYLTIYTDQDAPQDARISLASKVVIQALTIAASEPGAASARPALPPAVGPDQDSGISSPPSVATPGQPPGTPGAQPPGQETMVVSIDATARGIDGGTFVRHAVLRIGGDSPKGYTVLDWRRGELRP